MAESKNLNVADIKLDLNNYRTVPQESEENAINAMIAIKPERFYAIIDSIIDDGYLATENLIILNDKEYIVKEGNRRAAALKLIHGLYDRELFNLPDLLKKRIENISAEWKKENQKIPCKIYSLKEISTVNKIVSLTHAKGEKAGRDPWSSVARARQNRDEKNASEPTLDLLEKYLDQGKNITVQQKERWAGDYNYSVLDEALKYIINRIGVASIDDLAKKYPKVKYRNELEEMLKDIGLEKFGFKEIRATNSDFAADYNIPQYVGGQTPVNTVGVSVDSAVNTSNVSSNNQRERITTSQITQPNLGSPTLQRQASPKPKAYSIFDQRTVTQTLKKFNPKGLERQKLVTLKDELKNLKVAKNPVAFCFLLRSMFEISAMIYCKENSIPITETKNEKTQQKKLNQLLSAVTKQLTSNSSNSGMVKTLHGANTELGKSTGLLSVTSMNQLVHNTSFSIAPHDIFTLFNNIYPLLEAMN